MIDYYVKNSAGDTYNSANWIGAIILPNAVIHTSVSVDGVAVTFQPGNTYAIVITARNDMFTFTIVV